MKEELDAETRRAVIEYRLARAHETLREADYLAEGAFYSTAINRLYYACYYASVALLVAHHVETLTHAGVKTMLSLKFVKNNILSRQQAKTFFKLFDLRHNNDYDDFSFCDRETIESMRPMAQDFIQTVEKIVLARLSED